jgi:indole-3-glycerol phosphate synthase
MFLNKILDDCRARRQPTPQQIQDWRSQAGDQEPTRSLQKALCLPCKPRIIAEYKRASPSKGLIEKSGRLTPDLVANLYQTHGASAMSVLTEEAYFKGSFDDLKLAKASCNLPILRKDFLLEPWEITQSRAIGADAILLIVACLEPNKLFEMLEEASLFQLDVLVEVHTAEELEVLLDRSHPQLRLVGINNRNLTTFEVNLETSRELARAIPDSIIKVGESGFENYQQLVTFEQLDAFLVGESLMRQNDPGMALRELRGNP